MASIRSLGLHKPSGLHHAIQENLIAADAPPSAYVWDVIADHGSEGQVEDELLTTRDAVVWCRGRIFRKTFKFDLENETVTQALIARFPSSEAHRTDWDASKKSQREPVAAPPLEKALVVFLKTQAHIYFLSGTSHIVHMPFEVESAVAGPVGVVIQRKAKAESTAPVSLKFPRAPPSSFVSSHIAPLDGSQQTAFSVEGLGNPKALRLILRSTLENMWDAPMEQPESHWPRLLSLTDPLAEIGLIVTDSDPQPQTLRPPRRTGMPKSSFLDPAEEILHVEQIQLPVASSRKLRDPLVLGVTINRETSSYGVWRMTYMRHEDPFVGHKNNAKAASARRRSSMQPGFASGASTPVQQNFRESFGAPLPGKRQRKSDKADKPLDLVSSLEQQDSDGAGVTRRSSRRLSSMLARADLSASYERSVFAEQPLMSSNGASKRNEGRSSSSFQHQLHPSLGSLLEAPIDARLGEGLHNLGLEDRDFDGLQHEIRFTRIHTIALDNVHLRYSTSSRPARDQTKVFILTAPSFAVDEQQRVQLLIGIQDSFERRLQLINLQVRVQDKFGHAALSIAPREQWKVQNVVDSSKLVDGDLSVILVLSESLDGRHELSTQAPWIELTKVFLDLLFVDDTRDLQYRGRVADRDVKQKKSEVMDLSNGSIVSIHYPRRHGVVDVADVEGRLHQLQIQLQPSCPQVKRSLEVCKSVLLDSLGGRVHAGWLHAMQWLASRDEPFVNVEWSAFSILLFASYLNLGQPGSNSSQATRLPVRRRRPVSGSFGSIKESEDWQALEVGETANALGCPVWMMNKGWQWTLEDEDPGGDQAFAPKFLSHHIALAREYMASPSGEAALGKSGYLPTALGKNNDGRRKVAVDMLMALHLLLEEQKLDITTPEYASPGRADLRVLLCQIARWLKWHDFRSIYELGVQEDADACHDTGTLDLEQRVVGGSLMPFRATLEDTDPSASG